MDDNVSVVSETTPLVGQTTGSDKRRWRSIHIVYITNFLNTVGFSIVMSTIWPFLDSVGGSKSFLGLVIGAFSLGQLVGSTYWGYWASKTSYMFLFQLTIFIKVIGNTMYAFTASVPNQRDWWMLESRLIIGIGAGNMAICNSYVAGSTTVKERTRAMANLAASSGIGIIIGPLFGIAWGKLKPGYKWGALELNYMTGPAFTCFFLGIFNMLIIALYFREVRLYERKRSPSISGASRISTSSINTPERVPSPPPAAAPAPFDRVAVVSLLLTYIMTQMVLSVLETLATPFTMDEYAWTPQQADIYGGIIAGVFGAIALVVFIFIPLVIMKFGERQTLIYSLLIVLVGIFLFIGWGSARPKPWHNSPGDPDGAGCTEHWCSSTPQPNLAQYLIGTILVGIGYPAAAVVVFSLYSKVLGPAGQGVMMGVLTGCGSFARTVGPLGITHAYTQEGPSVTWAIICGCVILALLTTAVSYKRLLPHVAFRTPKPPTQA
eukprot:m.165333 g.165333  ORF g.165333 m.165333 type:complete len:492 (+) comp24969_c0_seq9:96-1571(+)